MLLLVGCAGSATEAPIEEESAAPSVVAERCGALLVLRAELGPDDVLRAPASAPNANAERLDTAALPLAVRRAGEGIACRRHEDGPSIHYLVFERTGAASAYGVYGLGGAKNDLPLSTPLSGDPIQWSGLDHEAALRRHLGGVGLDGAQLDALFGLQREVWFAEGLRVFFALDGEQAARLVPAAPEPPPRAALLCVELPRQ